MYLLDILCTVIYVHIYMPFWVFYVHQTSVGPSNLLPCSKLLAEYSGPVFLVQLYYAPFSRT